MNLLLRFFGGLKGYAIAIGAALITAIGIYRAGRKAGQDALRMKQAKKTLRDIKVANEINENVRTLSPDELDSRLSKYKRRN